MALLAGVGASGLGSVSGFVEGWDGACGAGGAAEAGRAARAGGAGVVGWAGAGGVWAAGAGAGCTGSASVAVETGAGAGAAAGGGDGDAVASRSTGRAGGGSGSCCGAGARLAQPAVRTRTSRHRTVRRTGSAPAGRCPAPSPVRRDHRDRMRAGAIHYIRWPSTERTRGPRALAVGARSARDHGDPMPVESARVPATDGGAGVGKFPASVSARRGRP